MNRLLRKAPHRVDNFQMRMSLTVQCMAVLGGTSLKIPVLVDPFFLDKGPVADFERYFNYEGKKMISTTTPETRLKYLEITSKLNVSSLGNVPRPYI